MTVYTRLENDENDDDVKVMSSHLAHPTFKASKIRLLASGFLVGVLVTTLIGFCFVFRRGPDSVTTSSLLSPAGSIEQNFHPDAEFQLGSGGSDQAWRTLIPEGMGFVQTPDLGPEIVGLAFVHQLHCLDILRHSYTSAINHTATPETTRHTGHCFEYLRQSLMCHADANIEYRHYNETLDRLETPGWDRKQCGDFEGLFKFAEKWRVFDGKSPSERERIGGDDLGRVVHYDYVSTRGDPVPVD